MARKFQSCISLHVCTFYINCTLLLIQEAVTSLDNMVKQLNRLSDIVSVINV